MYPIQDDQQLVLNLLIQERILLVQGSGFNWPATDHLRLVFLPREEDLKDAITRIGEFLERLRLDLA